MEEDFIMCHKHIRKFAKKFCKGEKCNMYICNACALEEHSDHLDKLVPISQLHANSADRLTKLTRQIITKDLCSFTSTGSHFKCMNFVFHEAKVYCNECKNFLCEKCKGSHHDQHTYVPIADFTDYLIQTTEMFLKLININVDYTSFGNLNPLSFDNDLDNLIEKIVKLKHGLKTKLRQEENVYFSLWDELKENLRRKEHRMVRFADKANEVQLIYDKIKFEKNQVKVYENLIQFEHIIESVYKDKTEKMKLWSLVTNMEKLRDFFNTKREDMRMCLQLKFKDLEEIASLLEDIYHKDTKECEKFLIDELGLSKNEYDMMSTSKFRTKGIETDEMDRLYTLQSINAENPVDLNMNPSSTSKNWNDLNMIDNQREISLECTNIKDKHKTFISQVELSNEVQIIATPIKVEPSIPISDVNHSCEVEAEEKTLSKGFSDIDSENEDKQVHEVKKERETKEEFKMISNDVTITAAPRTNLELLITEQTPSSFKFESTENTPLIFEVNKNPNCKESVIKNESCKSLEEISQEELLQRKIDLINVKISKISRTSTTSDYVEINLDGNEMKKPKPEQLVKEYLSLLTWEERNLIEIISLGQNCKSTFVFNPLTNLTEEIEFPHFKFPSHHAHLNVNPWVYLSGGKDKDGKEMSKFSKLRRISDGSYEIVQLPSMSTCRSSHTLIHHKGQLYAISGTRNKTCESFCISNDTWSPMPELNSSRERPAGFVFNDVYLYVFLGFDRIINKYVTNIERIKLDNTMTFWEVLNINGSQNVLKKQAIGTIQVPEGILLVGGINALRNETKEVLLYNFEKNSVNFWKNTLPIPASFSHSGFLKLSKTDDFMYNFTDNFSLIRFTGLSFNIN